MKKALINSLAAAATAVLSASAVAAQSEHFVLVHGAWHVADAWDGVIAELEKRGYTAEAVRLPGYGKEADRASVTFDEIETALVNAVSAYDGHVVLVGHSAAGVLLQQAAGKVADKLDAVVFHDAFLVPDGTSLFQALPPDLGKLFAEAAAASPDNSLPVDEGFWRHVLLAGVPEAEASRIIDTMVPQPFSYYTHKLDAASFADVTAPKFVLLATDDASLPPGAWQGMAMWLGDFDTIEIPGGHEVLLTDPAVVADGLTQIADKL